MSKLEVDTIAPQSGTTVTVGESGDTVTIPTGVTLDASNATTTLPATVVTTTGSQILTNKSIDSDNNTITNIVNADIKAGAAIDYSKLNLTGNIALADLSATGTKDATTFLRGDNTFAEAGGGKVLQVIHSNFSTYVNSTSTSYVQSGLTASITPSSTSSKILIFMNILGLGQNSALTSIRFKLVKNNTTDIIEFDDIAGYDSGSDTIGSNTSHLNYLDSPATTSSTTYTMYFKRQQGSGVIFFNNYVSLVGGTSSTITLMEIAG